jgi:integrase
VSASLNFPIREEEYVDLQHPRLPVAIQAQAGHRSITSTRIYLHLDMHWLAGEYRRAIEAIEAQGQIGDAQ